MLRERVRAGVEVRGVVGEVGTTGSVFADFRPFAPDVLDFPSDRLGLLHHKYAVVDGQHPAGAVRPGQHVLRPVHDVEAVQGRQPQPQGLHPRPHGGGEAGQRQDALTPHHGTEETDRFLGGDDAELDVVPLLERPRQLDDVAHHPAAVPRGGHVRRKEEPPQRPHAGTRARWTDGVVAPLGVLARSTATTARATSDGSRRPWVQ